MAGNWCECGQGPRAGGRESGCARCNAIDKMRFAPKQPQSLRLSFGPTSLHMASVSDPIKARFSFLGHRFGQGKEPGDHAGWDIDRMIDMMEDL